MKRIIVSTFLIVTLFFTVTSSAFAAPVAYIDPNTGGMIAQFLMVILAGLSGFFYLFKNRIVMFWNRLNRRAEAEPILVEEEDTKEVA